MNAICGLLGSRLFMRRAMRAVLPAEVRRHTSKVDPARLDPLRDAQGKV